MVKSKSRNELEQRNRVGGYTPPPSNRNREIRSNIKRGMEVTSRNGGCTGGTLPDQVSPRVPRSGKPTQPVIVTEDKSTQGVTSRRIPRKGSIRYPWRKWFTASGFLILKGVDYHCSTASMAYMTRQTARRLGVRVSIAVQDDDKGLWCRVLRQGRG